MTLQVVLHRFLDDAARLHAGRTAVEEPETGTAISYRELDELSDRLRDRLAHVGVRPGDRVGVYMRKSIDAVASIFGILKAGAAYVPVDPSAPPQRNAFILENCSVRAVVLERRYGQPLRAQLQAQERPALLELDEAGGGAGLRAALESAQAEAPAAVVANVVPEPDGLAYILYTSGSTGVPKGVMLSHRAGASFVNWCSEVFDPRPEDRFSSHAPLHFDLSILDLYLPLKHGATLVLIGEEIGKAPARLAPLIAERRISVWYSTPSILSLLAQYGRLAELDLSALRLVLFAGEVFPVKHLRTLKTLLPRPRYFNLYGPTETNVCTFYEVPPGPVPESRHEPYPIGQACSHYETLVVDEQGRPAAAGAEGELCAAGPGVMHGYWSLPEQSARAFLEDGAGRKWYRTGDVVTSDAEGNYLYLSRRDRMVKRRGYRVELGEIEAGLYRHAAVKEAAVIALPDQESGVRIKAFLSCHDEGARPSVIELKAFCGENLPAYMVPDVFSFQPALPKTSTDKIDYQRLKALG
jgi:amino acid adenylation domain-containing protein